MVSVLVAGLAVLLFVLIVRATVARSRVGSGSSGSGTAGGSRTTPTEDRPGGVSPE